MADRHFYLRRAYEKAFGQFDEASWDPEAGFKANEARILKLYDYYRDTYLARPDLFLWAGLGRMAGGAVIGGFRLLMTPGLFGLSTETFLTRTLVRIGKAIFHDLAWQHEAILDNPVEALALIAQHDLVSSARTSYALAWTHILSGNEVNIDNGNRMLLENEQFTVIQPQYDRILASPEAGVFRLTKSFTNSIHPYHRDFLLAFPTGDVLVAANRWAWITENGGMWAKWAERRRTCTTGRDV
jgi:hypothetical protein